MGLHSASSSSENRGSSLSSQEEEDVACTAPLETMAPWGEEENVAYAAPLEDNSSIGRGRERCAIMGFFVGCKSGDKKRALCENVVFLLVARLGRGRGRRARRGILLIARMGYLWLEKPIQPLLKKCSRKY
jgi:hypothetical protein